MKQAVLVNRYITFVKLFLVLKQFEFEEARGLEIAFIQDHYFVVDARYRQHFAVLLVIKYQVVVFLKRILDLDIDITGKGLVNTYCDLG